jgi:hypothetical protein
LTNLKGLELAFTLLVIFQFKHFIADFPLQIPYMLRKFRPGWDFLLPLATHCLVHGFLTLVICLIFAPMLVWLAGVDFIVHFIMDRIKSGPKYLGRFSNSAKSAYWIAFGFDQMVHHLTHIYIVWVIVSHVG